MQRYTWWTPEFDMLNHSGVMSECVLNKKLQGWKSMFQIIISLCNTGGDFIMLNLHIVYTFYMQVLGGSHNKLYCKNSEFEGER